MNQQNSYNVFCTANKPGFGKHVMGQVSILNQNHVGGKFFLLKAIFALSYMCKGREVQMCSPGDDVVLAASTP